MKLTRLSPRMTGNLHGETVNSWLTWICLLWFCWFVAMVCWVEIKSRAEVTWHPWLPRFSSAGTNDSFGLHIRKFDLALQNYYFTASVTNILAFIAMQQVPQVCWNWDLVQKSCDQNLMWHLCIVVIECMFIMISTPATHYDDLQDKKYMYVARNRTVWISSHNIKGCLVQFLGLLRGILSVCCMHPMYAPKFSPLFFFFTKISAMPLWSSWIFFLHLFAFSTYIQWYCCHIHNNNHSGP